jgi:hypothetical protein
MQVCLNTGAATTWRKEGMRSKNHLSVLGLVSELDGLLASASSDDGALGLARLTRTVLCGLAGLLRRSVAPERMSILCEMVGGLSAATSVPLELLVPLRLPVFLLVQPAGGCSERCFGLTSRVGVSHIGSVRKPVGRVMVKMSVRGVG